MTTTNTAQHHPIDVASVRRVAIISPALPPKLDGIGDYTACLATELARSAQVTVFTDREESPAPLPGVIVRGAIDVDDPKSARDLVGALAADDPDWAILQYNPFGWGRRGMNLQLPNAMHELRRAAPRTRLAIMFHETFVPVNQWKFAVMTTYQRWQFYRLGTAADALFFSISAWAERFAKWFPGKPIFHLPVGSNIPRVAIDRAEARGRLGLSSEEVALGIFGTAHVSRLLGLVRDAAVALQSKGRTVRVVYVGPHAAEVRRVLGNVPVLAPDGPLPANEVSLRLAAMDLFLATYDDGVSTRRGAMMAAMQHGVPILGTRGHLTDRELADADGYALALCPVNNAVAFAAAAVDLMSNADLRARLAAGAIATFERRYAWPAIAINLIDVLDRVKSRSA